MHLVQGTAIAPAPFARAGDAVDQEDLPLDVVVDVVADVVLDRRVAVDVGADLGEDLVPGAADLRVEIAAERAEVLVEHLGPPTAASLHPFANGELIDFQPLECALVALTGPPGSRPESGTFDDHLRHVGSHRHRLSTGSASLPP